MEARFKRVLGLDFGRVRVGVALSDELGSMAHPRPPLDGRNRKKLLEEVRKMASREEVGIIVVGLPLELSGVEGPAAHRARVFAQQIADATGCDVALVDERMTSRQAEDHLRAGGTARRHERRPRVDGAAAALILQTWLDGRGAAPTVDA